MSLRKFTMAKIEQDQMEGKCPLCGKKLRKDRYTFLGPLKVHKKCLIDYTAWTVKEDYPLESFDEQFFRVEQIRRNLQLEVYLPHSLSPRQKKELHRSSLIKERKDALLRSIIHSLVTHTAAPQIDHEINTLRKNRGSCAHNVTKKGPRAINNRYERIRDRAAETLRIRKKIIKHPSGKKAVMWTALGSSSAIGIVKPASNGEEDED